MRGLLLTTGIITASNFGTDDTALFYTFILSILFIGLFRSTNVKGFKLFLKKLRWTRIVHYILIFVFGSYLGLEGNLLRLKKLDFIEGFALIFSGFLAWVCAVVVNDISDVEIDMVNEPERPLITKALSRHDYLMIAAFTGFISLLCAGLVGFPFLQVMFTAIGVSMIYSLPPLRLKRFFLINQLIIGFASLLIFIQGYTFTCEKTEGWFTSVPFKLILGVLMIFTLASCIKDIRDRKGDKEGGVATIPVVFGPKLSQFIIVLLLLISYLSAGIVLDITAFSFYIVAVLFVLLNYFVLLKYNNETYLFWIYFVYATVLLIGYL
ncbi:UbiA family prenyltransferase [bacterium]|nr:UbiA family prenyltransferase [bacterium]